MLDQAGWSQSTAKNTIEHTKASYLEGIALILRGLETIDFIRCGASGGKGWGNAGYVDNVNQTQTVCCMIYGPNITQAFWRH